MMPLSLQATGSTAKAPLGWLRQVLLAAVFAAFGLLALHPYCSLAFTAAGHGERAGAASTAGQIVAAHPDLAGAPSGACCVGLTGGTLVKPADPPISWLPDSGFGALLVAFTGLLQFANPRNPVRFRLAVSPARSFYARSARILR